jgi:hypothetical protein
MDFVKMSTGFATLRYQPPLGRSQTSVIKGSRSSVLLVWMATKVTAGVLEITTPLFVPAKPEKFQKKGKVLGC